MVANSVVNLGAPALADGITFGVTTDQRVTVIGRSPSLKSVLEEVCFRAGAKLLYFDANDRPFGGSYRDLPLPIFLSRVLHNDSFIAESLGPSPSGVERIISVRILGQYAVATARRAKGGAPTQHWQAPPALYAAAFGANPEPDTAARDTAIAAMAARISNDPAQLKGFLGTDPQLIAQAIAPYKGVQGPLREMQKRYPDPRISKKIDEIIAALTAPGR